jgi:hypothetical protein
LINEPATDPTAGTRRPSRNLTFDRGPPVQYAPPVLRWPIAVIRLLPQWLFNKFDI